MPEWGILIILFCTFISFAVIHYIGKNKRPFKRSFISMCIGILTLLLINLTSSFTGVYIPVSLLSILISVIGGVPGVTLILALNLFF